jgi:cytochrome c oxidase subunit IV
MTQHVLPVRTYLMVFAALLALTATTVAVSFVELGPFHIAVALTIASVKAVLVALIFMHVLYSSRLIWLVIAAAILWLGILLALTFSDYWTRDWLSPMSHRF